MELNTSSIWFLLFRWIDALLHPSAGVLVAIVVVAWTILSPDSLRGFWMVAQQQGVVVACWEVVWAIWDTLRAYTHMALDWVRWEEDGALRSTAAAARRGTKRRPPPPLVVLNKSSPPGNNNNNNNNNNNISKQATSYVARNTSTPLNASNGSAHSHTRATNGNKHKPNKQPSPASAATATTSKSNSLSNGSDHTTPNTNNSNSNINNISIHSAAHNNNSMSHNGATAASTPNTDSSHSWETDEIEPAFLNADDYPPGWLVYHPILGVVPKEEADQYVDQQEQEQQHTPEVAAM